MSKNHSWPGKTHDNSNLLSHHWIIAMYRTFIASRLFRKEFTFFNSLQCVIQQVKTIITQLVGGSMMFLTIHLYHHLYGFLFSGNFSAHDQFMPRINVCKSRKKRRQEDRNTGIRKRESGNRKTGIGNRESGNRKTGILGDRKTGRQEDGKRESGNRKTGIRRREAGIRRQEDRKRESGNRKQEAGDGKQN